ncbi:MAG: RluA family pseudouridine synthase [Bacteroidota bacterium]|jgi:23S rRNA pseudouridine1911/1915/1917 synthase
MLSDEDILYCDNHLLVINKKPSQVVQADKTGDESLQEMAKQYIKIRFDKPGDVYLGIVHRIDRPVSGVLVFARTSKAAARISEAFREKKVQKTYWAVVKNQPPASQGTCIDYLVKNEKLNKSFVTKEPAKGQKSELHYKLLGKSDNYYLLEVKPITGRHHQIRAQLSAMGCPIKGDVKYGFDRTNKDASIHLHARRIVFPHPVKEEMTDITAPVPKDPIWQFFENMKP